MTSTESTDLINSYKKMFGLFNVDNTSDSQKPISDLTQAALDTKLSLSGGILTGGLTGTTANFSDQLTGTTGIFNDDVQFNGNIAGTTGIFTFSDVQFNGGLTGTTGTFTGLVNFNNINGSNGTFTNGFTSGGLNLIGGLTGTTAFFTGIDISNGENLTGGLTGTTATFSGNIIANTSGSTGISMSNLSSQIQTLQNSVNSTNLNNLPSYKSDLDAYNNGLTGNSLYLKNGSINVLKNGFNSLYSFTTPDTNSSANKTLTSTTYTRYTDLVNKNNVTFEIWIYPIWNTTIQLEQYFFDNRLNNTGGFYLGIFSDANQEYSYPIFYSDGNLSEVGNSIPIKPLSPPTTMTNRTWNHIAFIFSKLVRPKVYLNGTECQYNSNSNTFGTNYITTTAWNGIKFGSFNGNTNKNFNFNGHIGGVRISDTILYNSAGFTPPTFFSKTSSTVFLMGPNFKELINGNQLLITGSSGYDIYNSFSFINSSAVLPFYQTAYQISSTNLLQMYGSFYDLLSNSWTIECWVKTNAINTYYPSIISLNNGNSWFKIRMDNTGRITFNVPSSTPYLTSGSTLLVTNKWSHIALTRNRTTITLYIDGTSCATSTTMPNLSNVIFDNISIGNAWNATGPEQNSTFDGLISQVHISKKVLYSANFSAPLGLYPSDISSTIFYLGNNYNDIITGKSLRVGNPSIVTF